MNTKLYLLLAIGFILTSCEETLLGPVRPNDPIANFDEMWKSYDQWYGLFQVKDIDWHATYAEYRPQVDEFTSDETLKAIFKNMIDPLNDNHVYLITTQNEPRIESGIFDTLKVQTDFDLNIVDTYAAEFHHYDAALDYGILADQTGYIHFGDFIPTQAFHKKALDHILDQLEETRGLVIDIRDNAGGGDAVAQYVAGRFANDRHHYMTVRKKDGPDPNDFTQAIEWFVEPTGGTRYTKPIVLLTSRWTQSAGETFALAMKEMDHVTLVGDYTSGAFSDNIARELPNGWLCFISIGDYRASDGKSYEGIGIEPDIRLVNTKDDILSGRDKALERAIEFLR